MIQSEVTMAETSRAVRYLKDDIAAAQHRLYEARRDGNCERINKAAARVDELLDRLSAHMKQPEQPTESQAQ